MLKVGVNAPPPRRTIERVSPSATAVKRTGVAKVTAPPADAPALTTSTFPVRDATNRAAPSASALKSACAAPGRAAAAARLIESAQVAAISARVSTVPSTATAKATPFRVTVQVAPGNTVPPNCTTALQSSALTAAASRAARSLVVLTTPGSSAGLGVGPTSTA